jgi:lambda repressor-like predicted transcriptional regulator
MTTGYERPAKVDRNAPLHDAVRAAVRASGRSHRQIAADAEMSMQSLNAKLQGQRPWRLRDLPMVASAIGDVRLAAEWVDMLRIGDLDVRA